VQRLTRHGPQREEIEVIGRVKESPSRRGAANEGDADRHPEHRPRGYAEHGERDREEAGEHRHGIRGRLSRLGDGHRCAAHPVEG
jgi:hypothetical protein